MNRLERKSHFDGGDIGALIDDIKWKNSGHWWNDDAIELFRSFYSLSSPTVYLDHTGRKISYINFDGKREYDFVYGINPQRTHSFILVIY